MTCKKIYCIDSFSNCGNINLPIGIPDGAYDLVITIGRRSLNMEGTITAGILELCTSYLSVDREIYLQFYQSGTLILHNGYDAFTFTINNYGAPASNTDCSTSPCSGGATNLTFSRDGTTVTVESSTGTDAVLPAATTSLAGVMSAADKSKLDGIATGANKIDDATDVPFDNTNTGFTATNVQAAIDEAKAYVDSSVTGTLVYKGGYNASTNTPNLTSGSGIKTGDTYVITTAGTFHGEAVQVGDMIIAKQNTPTTLAHWTLVNKNIPDIVDASTTVKGLVEEATEAEAKSPSAEVGGTGAKLFVTPKQLHAAVGSMTDLTRRYTTLIGDGTSTQFTIIHGITNAYPIVSILELSTFTMVEAAIEIDLMTNVIIKFNTPPTSNQYAVIVHG